jgi:hypothetical protein
MMAEELPEWPQWDGFVFPTPRPGHPDWPQYLGVATDYVEPFPWVFTLAPEMYYQEGVVEGPSDNEDGGDYEPMEVNLVEEEAIHRAMLVSQAVDWAKWIGLEEAIQLS